MDKEELKALEADVKNLVVALHDVVEWQWDGRFRTVLAEFPIDRKAEVLSVLEKRLVRKWDASNVDEAPNGVREIASSLGGLMSGQLLLLSDPDAEPIIYCAWWPWESGQRISIRIGVSSKVPEQKEALVRMLRDRFDL